MRTNRRAFISSVAFAGGSAAISPSRSFGATSGSSPSSSDYSTLDKALKLPVLKRELFAAPVIIETIELLQDRNNFICRVRSKDGAEGVSIGHPFISKNSYPMFNNCVRHRFLGKDARDLDRLVFDVAERNVKNQGIPLCVQIATLEFAVLDMLGTIANKPVGQLIGDIHNPMIAVYLGTRIGALRREKPEVSLPLVQKDWAETKAKAIKIRGRSW